MSIHATDPAPVRFKNQARCGVGHQLTWARRSFAAVLDNHGAAGAIILISAILAVAAIANLIAIPSSVGERRR